MPENTRPRICDVIGLDTNDQFEVANYNGIYFIDCAGEFRSVGKEDSSAVVEKFYALLEAINNPESVKRKHHWTAEDIEDAKAIKRLYQDAARVYRGENTKQCVYLMDMNAVPTGISFPRKSIFPSLRPGETVTLDEILEAGDGI